ncbi:expressed unknown protein [Seminavis robusta]|uniref:histidine kinase n=1 Tax=Seminavis robusta TaxID=568900 RepID=A0A9N8DF64_9STRA|nr:expressed unknown protein [Seminavis robusta]|eukprot:Sro60_g034530.2  (967) ;mRNA; r:18090-20990
MPEDTPSPPDAASSGTSTSTCSSTCYCRQDLQALNLLDQPVWIFDIVKRGMFWANAAAVELWSANSLESLVARNFGNDMSEATQNRLDDYLLKFISGETTQEQWTFYPKGGESVVVDCLCKGVPIEEGRVAMLVQATKRTNATSSTLFEQEALRATEMLRHLPVAVCIADLQGNILEQNPEALAVFGSLETAKQQQQQQVLSDSSDSSNSFEQDEEGDNDNDDPILKSAFVKRFADPQLGKRILHQAAETGQDVTLEAQVHTVHGTQWSAIKVRQTKDPVTSKPILLMSARDITAVVEAKRQATTAELDKLDLLADMAHAIRTPLQHVVGVVELMAKQDHFKNDNNHNQQQSKTHNRHYSNLLQSSAQLLMTVIHDLMDTVGGTGGSSISGNNTNGHGGDQRNPTNNHPTNNGSHHLNNKPRILLEHTQLDVKEVLKNAVATLRPHAKAKDLTLRATIHSRSLNNGTAALMGDPARLGQILFNILHNAVKYTSRGGINVSVRRLSLQSSRRVRLRFEVKDSGVGMNLEQQRQCMRTKSWKRSQQQQQDQQQQQQEKDASDHGGVGLSRCKTLVDAMGGTMGVQSKPGQGATFWVEIPFLRVMPVKPPPSTNCSNLSNHGNSNTNNGNNTSSNNKDNRRLRRVQRKGSNSSTSSLQQQLDPVPDEGGLQVLLVDKDNAGRSVMTALMEESGYQVTTVADGDAMVQAVTESEDASFDVVLLETQLSSSNDDGNSKNSALQAVKQLRTLGYSTERLPIIALTAAVPRADYPELGLNDWLTKPMLIKDIQKAMTNAICNMGTTTHHSRGSLSCGGSICTEGSESIHHVTLGESCSDNHGSSGRLTGTTGSSSHADSRPVLPRRGSFGSVHSVFSDHLQAAMAPVTDEKTTVASRDNKPRLSQPTVTASIVRPSTHSMNTSPSRGVDRPPSKIHRRNSDNEGEEISMVHGRKGLSQRDRVSEVPKDKTGGL